MKEIRKRRGITLDRLSDLTDIPVPTLARYEKTDDIYTIPYNKAHRIADALNVNFKALSSEKTIDSLDTSYNLDIVISDLLKDNIDKSEFDSYEKFLNISDIVEEKIKLINELEDVLMKINQQGIKIITEYISFVSEKDKYYDKNFLRNLEKYNNYKHKIYKILINNIKNNENNF